MRSYRRFLQKGFVPHPGEILRDLYLEPLKITVLEAANSLSISEAELYSVLRGQDKITAQLANQLSIMFNTTSGFWLNLQHRHDQVTKSSKK